MNVIFDNRAHDCVAPFIAESLRKAVASIDSMRGETAIIFTTEPVEETEKLGKAQPQCFAIFTVISDESAYHFPFPSPRADTCNGILYYSLTEAVYAYPALHIQTDSLNELCRLIVERLIKAFTES